MEDKEKKLKIAGACLSAIIISFIICGYALKRNISVQAQVLTTEDQCIRALGNRGYRLVRPKKKKIYPIQLSIANNTPTTISLSQNDIKLNMVPPAALASRLKLRNEKNKSLLLKIIKTGGIVFAGCVGIGMIGGISALAYLGAFTSNAVAAGDIPFLIAFSTGIGACAGTIVAPSSMIYELTKKQKKKTSPLLNKLDSTKIKPGETKKVFIFVYEKNIKENFSITFSDENQNEISLDVDLSTIERKQI